MVGGNHLGLRQPQLPLLPHLHARLPASDLVNVTISTCHRSWWPEFYTLALYPDQPAQQALGLGSWSVSSGTLAVSRPDTVKFIPDGPWLEQWVLNRRLAIRKVKEGTHLG